MGRSDWQEFMYKIYHVHLGNCHSCVTMQTDKKMARSLILQELVGLEQNGWT